MLKTILLDNRRGGVFVGGGVFGGGCVSLRCSVPLSTMILYIFPILKSSFDLMNS
jgi:hypothetical protein